MDQTYDANFEAEPQVIGNAGVGYRDIQQTRTALRERLALEHRFDFAKNTEQGLHAEGSAFVKVYLGMSALPDETRASTGLALKNEDKGYLVYHLAQRVMYVWTGEHEADIDGKDKYGFKPMNDFINLGLKTDLILESTDKAGVRVDSVTLKDGSIQASNTDSGNDTVGSNIEGVQLLKGRILPTYLKIPSTVGNKDGDMWIE